MAACKALIGSISVTMTRAPNPRKRMGASLCPRRRSRTRTATLPATITSVARLMPSASDSRQP